MMHEHDDPKDASSVGHGHSHGAVDGLTNLAVLFGAVRVAFQPTQ